MANCFVQGKVWRKWLGLPTVAKGGKILVWVDKWYVWPSRALLLFLQLNWTIVRYLKPYWRKNFCLCQKMVWYTKHISDFSNFSTMFVWCEYWILMWPLEGTTYIRVTGGGGGSWRSWCRLLDILDSSRFVIMTKTLSQNNNNKKIKLRTDSFSIEIFLLRNTGYSVMLGISLIFIGVV